MAEHLSSRADVTVLENEVLQDELRNLRRLIEFGPATWGERSLAEMRLVRDRIMAELKRRKTAPTL
jgi:hypothetical protein